MCFVHCFIQSTFEFIKNVRIQSRLSKKRMHNVKIDFDHSCMKSKPDDVNVHAAVYNCCCRQADFTNSNESKKIAPLRVGLAISS